MLEKAILNYCENCKTISKQWSLRCPTCAECRNFEKKIIIPKITKTSTSRKRKGFSQQYFNNNVTFDQLQKK